VGRGEITLKLGFQALRVRRKRYLHPGLRDPERVIGPTASPSVSVSMKAIRKNGVAAVERQRFVFALPKRVSALAMRFTGLWFGAWFLGGVILELVRELAPH
jgi:hypothetical protein